MRIKTVPKQYFEFFEQHKQINTAYSIYRSWSHSQRGNASFSYSITFRIPCLNTFNLTLDTWDLCKYYFGIRVKCETRFNKVSVQSIRDITNGWWQRIISCINICLFAFFFFFRFYFRCIDISGRQRSQNKWNITEEWMHKGVPVHISSSYLLSFGMGEDKKKNREREREENSR